MEPEELTGVRRDIRHAALDYGRQGFKVVRLHGIVTTVKGGKICSCWKKASCGIHSGKHPSLGNGWPELATSDADTIARWWDEKPESNVGIATGGDFGLVIDLDLLRHGETGQPGPDVWEELQEAYGRVPQTKTIQTGSGGKHLVFREPPGRESLTSLPGIPGGRKIDIKRNRGLVVAPPSLHVSGNQYQLVIDMEPALAPDWFYQSLPHVLRKVEKGANEAKQGRNLQTKAAALTNFDEAKVNSKIRELNKGGDPKAKLSEETLELLREGRPGADQSAVVQSIITGAISKNFCIGTLFLMLEDPANAGGEGMRSRIKSRGRDNVIDDWMARSIRNARKYLAEGVLAVEVIRNSVELYEWVPTEHWLKGQKKMASVQSMKRVLYAALDLAEKYTTTKPMLSKSMIAEVTGLSLPTVRSGFHGLVELGWLRVESKRHGAWTYRFLDPSERVNSLLSSLDPASRNSTEGTSADSRRHLATKDSNTYVDPDFVFIPPELDGVMVNRPPGAPALRNFE